MTQILETKHTHLVLVSRFIYQHPVLTISGHDWQFITGQMNRIFNSWKTGHTHGFHIYSNV
jgi:hypothetical protein